MLYNLRQSYEDVCVSSVMVFEIYYGCQPEHDTAIMRVFQGFTHIPFDAEIARVASRECKSFFIKETYVR